MSTFDQSALDLHKKLQGKIALSVKCPLKTSDDLSTAYTPGVGAVSREIADHPESVWDLTARSNSVAIVTDGSAVLGLGDIGPEAALPVMEGKAALMKEFANIDAFPLCLKTNDVDEIVSIMKALESTFGGINLEDIAAPRCFEIEQRLEKELNIPVFHDDQHGTAIVVTAGLMNAVKVTDRSFENIKVVVSGAGAAGTAITKMLLAHEVTDILVCDSKGIISKDRGDLHDRKKELAEGTNPSNVPGSLADALKDADVFIGVSRGGLLTEEMIKTMNADPIIFAMANPDPEIMPDAALKAGAKIVATGRSDFPNQVNNILAFPGVFRGALDTRAKSITPAMKLAAVTALAEYVSEPSSEKILPDPLEKDVVKKVAEAVQKAV